MCVLGEEVTSSKKSKPVSSLVAHQTQKCGCSITVNPNFCVYQPFLDGWDFTPDVGNGGNRGEVFTPRFVVDLMISDSNILPKKMVYQYDYNGIHDVLEKYLTATVFEPATGTGNFISTILWHKLEIANQLTLPENGGTTTNGVPVRSEEELLRYQTNTLKALSSIFVNDIDAGNLQTTKWRLFRNSEIHTEENINFWVEHVYNSLATETKTNNPNVTLVEIKKHVTESIQIASKNWGSFDEDKGVLDVLYKKHVGQSAPEWLRSAWSHILNTNSKLFNMISDSDMLTTVTNDAGEVEIDTVFAGNQNVVWVFRTFGRYGGSIFATECWVPQKLQQLMGEREELKQKMETLTVSDSVIEESNQLSIFDTVQPLAFGSLEDKKQYGVLQRKVTAIDLLLQKFEVKKTVWTVREEDQPITD